MHSKWSSLDEVLLSVANYVYFLDWSTDDGISSVRSLSNKQYMAFLCKNCFTTNNNRIIWMVLDWHRKKSSNKSWSHILPQHLKKFTSVACWQINEVLGSNKRYIKDQIFLKANDFSFTILTGGISKTYKWQQASSGLQNPSKYSCWPLKGSKTEHFIHSNVMQRQREIKHSTSQ